MKKNLDKDLVVKNLERKTKPYFCMSESKTEKGFGVLVYPSGSMTFVYKYKIDGVQKMLTLGEYPDVSLASARFEYLKASLKVKDLRKGCADGADPVLERKRLGEIRIQKAAEERKEYTFDQLAKEYIENNVEGQLTDKSIYDIKRVLLGAAKKEDTLDDFKTWRSEKASTITTEDVAKLLKTVSARSAASARNIIKTARPMFAYALVRGIVAHNPFVLSGIKSFLSKPIKSKLEATIKSRTLSAEEIRHLWKSLSAAKGSPESKNSLKTILLTGQRPSEVLGLNSGEIQGNWWTLPKARTKSRLDKNRKDHVVFLVPEVLQIIGTKTGHYFESPLENKPIAINALGHMIRNNNYFGLAPWGAHDLRRTCRTFMSDIDGITANAAEAVLNHARVGVTANYDHHDYQRQIEKALTLWRDKLVEIIGEPLIPALPDNVIPMRRKAA